MKNVRASRPPLQELLQRDEVFVIVVYIVINHRIEAEWLCALDKELGEKLFAQFSFRVHFEDFLAIRIPDFAFNQVIAIHQEMKTNIPVRGIYFDERLTLAQVAARFGCHCDRGCDTHDSNSGGGSKKCI